MDHTNYPMATAIPLPLLQSFEDMMDWDDIYGRLGTEKLIYSDYYHGGEKVPEHLVGVATHVWLYWEK